MPTINAIPTDQFNGRSKPQWSCAVMVPHGARVEHTVMVGLRRCNEAVRFLTPICDPFFGIAVAIEHFVRFTVKEQWTTSCNCRGKTHNKFRYSSGFQIRHQTLCTEPFHSFDPRLPVLLSSYVRISTSGSLRRRRIFDEDESPC
jgi:hypothetical protein